jgi:hypothetical protein
MHFVKQHDLLRELAIYNSKRGPIRRRERVIIEISGNNIPKWWKEQKYQPIKARRPVIYLNWYVHTLSHLSVSFL